MLLGRSWSSDLSGLAHGRGGAPQPALSVASTSMVSGASTPGSFAAETSTSDSDVEYMIIPDTDYALDLGDGLSCSSRTHAAILASSLDRSCRIYGANV